MSSSEKRASNRRYFQIHAAEILGTDASEKAAELHNAKYEVKLTEEIDEFLTGLFRSPEAQRIMREACKAALVDAVAHVLADKRDALRADVLVLVMERWQAEVETAAQAVLAEELGRIKRRITGGT